MFSESDFASHVVARFGARVVILYGSAARGEMRSDSDIDVVCFVEQSERYPDSYVWQGLLVDAWIHPLSDAESSAEFLKLLGGHVLRDHDALGRNLLARVTETLERPREKLDARHERHRKAWVWKMFDRATQSGIGADYRRHWLLFDLPETWSDLTGHHYTGPDTAFKTMKAEAPLVYEAVMNALSAGSSLAAVERAVEAVVGPRGDSLIE